MWLYFTCSFRNSKLGYRMAAYNLKTNLLVSIDEDKENQVGMPPVCSDIFNHEVGRTMLLSTDENGELLFSVLNLIEGNYEKYVNIIFSGDKSLIYKTFLFFCSNYEKASKIIIDSISKRDDCSLGYEIKDRSILNSLYDQIMCVECGIIFHQLPRKKLVAYISEDCFEDNVLNINEIYQNKDVEKYIMDSSKQIPLSLIEHLNSKLGNISGGSKLKANLILAILVLAIIVFIFFFCI